MQQAPLLQRKSIPAFGSRRLLPGADTAMLLAQLVVVQVLDELLKEEEAEYKQEDAAAWEG